MKGMWIEWTDDFKDYVKCSQCDYGEEGEVYLGEETNYCPHCGAEMVSSVDEMAEEETIPKWIPCTQELPELNKRILVTAYHRTCYGMMISRSGNGGFPIFRLQDSLNERTVSETISHGQYSQGRIDAWMPLPEPYKAESEET